MPIGIRGFQKGHTFGKRFQKGNKVNLGKKNAFGSKHPHSDETKRKISNAHKKNPVRYWLGRKDHPCKGNKNHLWRGGITPLNKKIRNSPEYKLWRSAVFKRDNFQCIWGGKEHGNKLNADHIKPFSQHPELRFAIDNGRTLCEECHKKTDTYLNKSRWLLQ